MWAYNSGVYILFENFMTVHKLQLKQTGNTISGTEDEGRKSPKDGDVGTDQQPSLQCTFSSL